MGYRLTARKSGIESFRFGAFSWAWLINAGVGLPVGQGAGVGPATYVYRRDMCDDLQGGGARVTAKQARDMAKLARWVADYQDTLHEVCMQDPEEERQKMREHESRYSIHYNWPVRRDFVELARKFADWAEKSGGFRVY